MLESGQPYSVIDYTGAVGSIFYGVYDGIINPIVPLAPGCTSRSAVTGATGARRYAGAQGVLLHLALASARRLGWGDSYRNRRNAYTFETNFASGERNIFRQAWQKRADISLVKDMRITERVSLKYTLDVFNLTNTASFDIPIDNVSQNQNYNSLPIVGTTPLPTSCNNLLNKGFYNCPAGLGQTNKTIGGPRQIQMSLHLTF